MTDNHDNGAVPPSNDVANERLRNPHTSLHHKAVKLLKMRGILPSDFSESSNVSPESLAHLTLSLGHVLPEFGNDRAAAQRFYNDVERVMSYDEKEPNVPVIDIMFRAEEIRTKQKDVKTKPQAIKIALGIQTVPVRIDLLERISNTLDHLVGEARQLRQEVTDLKLSVTQLSKDNREAMERLKEFQSVGGTHSEAVLPRPESDGRGMVKPGMPGTLQPVPCVPVRPVMRSGKLPNLTGVKERPEDLRVPEVTRSEAVLPRPESKERGMTAPVSPVSTPSESPVPRRLDWAFLSPPAPREPTGPVSPVATGPVPPKPHPPTMRSGKREEDLEEPGKVT